MSKMLSRIGLVSAFTMLSRVLGLARDMLTSAVFGTSVWNSAFVLAFTLPNLFRRLLGEGALTAALMPNLSEELEANGRPGVFALANKTLSWLLAACLILIALVWVAAGIAQSLLVSEKWALAAELTMTIFPYVALVCLSAIVSAVLNLLNRFGIPALTAVWLNISILVCLGGFGWWAGEDLAGKMTWLCVGVLVGGALQLAIPVWALMREGWRPRLDFALSPAIREVMWRTLPGVYGASAHQVAVLMSGWLAFTISESGTTLLFYANRLVELPLGVFTIAISTVIFPALSKLALKGGPEFAAMYRKGLILSVMIALPAAAGLGAIAGDAIRLLFQRGMFGPEDTRALAPILLIFALGMPFYAMLSIELRAFYATKDLKTPVKAATMGLALNLVLSLSLIGWLEEWGLAIASNASAAFQMIFLHAVMRKRRPEFRDLRIGGAIAKMALAAAAMGLAVWGVKLGVGTLGLGGPIHSAAVLAAGIPFGVAVYFGLIRAFDLPEAKDAFGLLKRVLKLKPKQ